MLLLIVYKKLESLRLIELNFVGWEATTVEGFPGLKRVAFERSHGSGFLKSSETQYYFTVRSPGCWVSFLKYLL
ncbi:hypothetical protein [Nostoc sp.]|uniref:hypothetical protein n=1 Tax=Nostoc sp. TaxID=1180 RepID=UPI002FF7DAFF